jgi:hypothetical protein
MDRYAIKLGKEPPLFDVRVVAQTSGNVLPKRKEATSTCTTETGAQKAEINNLSRELWALDINKKNLSMIEEAMKSIAKKDKVEASKKIALAKQEAFIRSTNNRYKLLKSPQAYF